MNRRLRITINLSGVWFSASRRKPRLANFFTPPIAGRWMVRREFGRDAQTGTPEARASHCDFGVRV
jgi:hypothetical protein